MSDAGTRKSAILLMSLGEDRAAATLAHLPATEVQALGAAMAKLSQVSKDELAAVLAEFRMETEQLSALHLGSGSYIRAVLRKALGDDAPAERAGDPRPVEGLAERPVWAGGDAPDGQADDAGRGRGGGRGNR